ncbi:hypothetical protein RRG08_025906 [Elysia crispata]|uniref:Uncharacterized protein n=1 Tax=Elysia crispata TaxID=231223 RepID=A0AAE1DZ18_9GAST|nr:hypothetical protein RRG08_025906 [Elysia crispata]
MVFPLVDSCRGKLGVLSMSLTSGCDLFLLSPFFQQRIDLDLSTLRTQLHFIARREYPSKLTLELSLQTLGILKINRELDYRSYFGRHHPTSALALIITIGSSSSSLVIPTSKTQV